MHRSGYKVTLFVSNGPAVSAIAPYESDAVKAAAAKLPAGARLTGRRTERVDLPPAPEAENTLAGRFRASN